MDDATGNRLLLSTYLVSLGFEVLEAGNGREAVNLFQQHPEINFIFADVFMPEMNGMDAVKAIKNLAGDRYIPVLFLSATLDEETQLNCLEAGGDDFLQKPYEPITLRARIESLSRLRMLQEKALKQNTRILLEQERKEEEQFVAERIFSQAVSRAHVNFKPIEYYQCSAETFSGDVCLSASRAHGGLNVFLGDFTGHGLASAVGILPVSNIFRAMAFRSAGLLDVLREMNDRMYEVLPTGMFMGAGMLMFARDMRSVAIWNGGLPPILIIDGQTGKVRKKIHSAHLPLGILPEFSAEQQYSVYGLNERDRVLIYSDGLLEEKRATGEIFGEERLQALVAEAIQSSKTITETLQDYLDQKGFLEQVHDDITWVEVPSCKELASNTEKLSYDRSLEAIRAIEKETLRSFQMTLNGLELRDLYPVSTIIEQMQECRGEQTDTEELATLLSELFNNALDHGVMALNSEEKRQPDGFERFYQTRLEAMEHLTETDRITFDISLMPQAEGWQVDIVVTDSGEGFDVEKRLKTLKNTPSEAERMPFGRGIQLIFALSESVEYRPDGCQVTVVYLWQ